MADIQSIESKIRQKLGLGNLSSLIDGFVQLVDLGINPHDNTFYRLSDFSSDQKTQADDWREVGQDIRKAIQSEFGVHKGVQYDQPIREGTNRSDTAKRKVIAVRLTRKRK